MKFTMMYIQVKDDHALVVISQDNMLGKLQESNRLLEEIQKGLNDYLEKKRLYFARLMYTAYTHTHADMLKCIQLCTVQALNDVG